MTDSENWRLERAAKLGLEPYGHSLVKLSPIAPEARPISEPLRVPDPVRIGTGHGDDVVPMRYPSPIGAARTDRVPRQVEPEHSAFDGYPRRDPATPSASRGRNVIEGPASRKSDWGPATRASLYVGGTALAAAIAAAGGAWFAIQQNRSPPPVLEQPVSVQPSAAAPVEPLVLTVAAEEAPTPPDFIPIRCAEPGIVAGVRAAASDKLRRSAPDTRRGLTIGYVTGARPKIAGADGSLMLCTAVLNLQRGGRRFANIDVDYAVRTAAGTTPQLVPLGFNHALDKVITTETLAARRVPVETAALAGPEAPAPKTAVRQASASDSAPPRIVVSRQGYAPSTPLGFSSASLGLSTGATLDRTAGPFEARAAVLKPPRGCEQAITRSMAMTCNDAGLLAMNSIVRATIAQYDQSRYRPALARIKASADKRFDRCTTVPCVENAYRYWLDALAKVGRRSEPRGTRIAEQRQDATDTPVTAALSPGRSE